MAMTKSVVDWVGHCYSNNLEVSERQLHQIKQCQIPSSLLNFGVVLSAHVESDIVIKSLFHHSDG